MVIITLILAAILISKILIVNAKVNKIYQDYRDTNVLINIFQNTFDCLPGDCTVNQLTQSVINGTPSVCFNLQTTTNMGNANSPGNSLGTTTILSGANIIDSFNTGTISSPLNRTCAFWEMQAFEPSAFGGSTTKVASISSLFGLNKAWAIGSGLLKLPSISSTVVSDCASFVNVPSAAIWGCDGGVYGGWPMPCGTSQFWSGSGNANQMNTVQYYINITSLSSTDSYIAQMAADDHEYLTVNGVDIGHNGGSAYQNYSIQNALQLGMNLITLKLVNYSGNYGACFQIINPSTSFTAKTVCTGNSSSTLFSGCSGASPSDAYCSSACYKNNISKTPFGNDFAQAYNAISSPNGYLYYSVPNVTQPVISPFSTTSMWDMRTVGSMGTSGFYPYELNDATNLSSFKNVTILISRNSSADDITSTNDMAGLPAYIALKLDNKFDDGMPYSGNMISGQNASQFSTGKGCTQSTTISANSPVVDKTTNYITSKTTNLSYGCVVGWKLSI